MCRSFPELYNLGSLLILLHPHMKATDVDEVLLKLDKAINGLNLRSILHTLDPLISSQTAWTAFYTQLSQCICQPEFFGAMSKMNQAEAYTKLKPLVTLCHGNIMSDTFEAIDWSRVRTRAAQLAEKRNKPAAPAASESEDSAVKDELPLSQETASEKISIETIMTYADCEAMTPTPAEAEGDDQPTFATVKAGKMNTSIIMLLAAELQATLYATLAKHSSAYKKIAVDALSEAVRYLVVKACQPFPALSHWAIRKY